MPWERIVRVGTLDVKQVNDASDEVQVRFKTAPSRQPEKWKAYFNDKAFSLGLQVDYDSWGINGDSGLVAATVDDFEHRIEQLDQALAFANDEYEKNDLPEILREEQLKADRKKTAEERQVDLNARAQKLAKPEPERRW